MMTESSPPTISEKARTCLISFEKCLAQMTTLDYLSQSLIENEFARFSVWTSNIGVFANGRASMDHRLREAPDVQKLVLGLLDVLFRRIDKYLSSLRNTNDSLLSDPDGQAATADAFLKSEVEYIASEISLLHELSNTIRKASRKTTDVKAAALFHIQDDEGNDLEEPLKNYFATNIRDQFPGISDVLRLRLAKAMVVRRKRILYKRSRFAPMRIAQPSNQPVIQAPITKETDPGSVILEDVKESKPLAPLQPLFSSVAKSITKSATTLAPQNYQKATAPSVISQSKTIALGSHQDLVFPSVPKHDPTTIEITCPFCMLILPIKDIKDEKSWREHLKNDLDPYVCLTEDCDCPDELFRHSGEWLRHMRKHSLHWRCASKSHGSMFFSTRDDYISHMNEKHGKAINDEQIAVLADRSLQLNGPLFKSCPLCGIEAQDYTGPLEDHIVGHLRSLALKSLPPIHNEDEVEDGLGENDKTDRERSTVKNDPDHHMPLDFELDSSNPYDLVGDVSSEEADDYWDFMPINTKANLHEDAIIQHLTEQFPNVFDLPESAEEEVNQGVDADADEDTDASKPEAEQDAQPDSGAKADPEFDMSPAKIEALFTPKERGSRKSKPKDEPEAETELEPESKSNVNQWQNSSERLRSLSGRIANNLKPFKQTPEEVADPVYPLSLPPPASNLDEEEEEAAEVPKVEAVDDEPVARAEPATDSEQEDQDQTWPPPLTDIRPIGRGEMRDNYLQRIWRQPHEQPASPIPHFDLSGEQEGSKVEGQSTAFEKFIDEIEDRWQSEKEAWAQKGFESEGFFAFLDHHFDSPGVVLPDSQLQLKLSTLEKYQTALRVHEWHNKKRLTQDFANTPPAAQQKSIATYSHNFQQYFGNQMGSKQMVGGVPQNQSSPIIAPGGPDGNALNAFYSPDINSSNHALQDYQMQLMLLEQQDKKRLMMARQKQSDMGRTPEAD